MLCWLLELQLDFGIPARGTDALHSEVKACATCSTSAGLWTKTNTAREAAFSWLNAAILISHDSISVATEVSAKSCCGDHYCLPRLPSFQASR